MSAGHLISAARLADPAVGGIVYGFAEEAARARSEQELVAAMTKSLAFYDIRHFLLYQATDANKRPTATKISGVSHGQWRQHYAANDFADSDELLRAGLNSPAPTTWTKFRSEHVEQSAQTLIYDEARAFNLHDGFYLPIHQHDGSMLGVSMMLTQTLPINPGSVAVLHLLAVSYAMAAERLGLIADAIAGAPRRTAAVLTPRQIECLEWITAGKSSWEIGEILNLSEHTVNEHLEAARRRLGVRTTTQAVLVAALRHLIRSHV